MAYLDTDTCKDEAFVFTLLACAVPPSLETEYPVPRPPEATALGVDRLVVIVGLKQVALPFADDEELLVLSLEQADTDRQVDAHGPELHVARVAAVEVVDHEDHEEVNVKDKDR